MATLSLAGIPNVKKAGQGTRISADTSIAQAVGQIGQSIADVGSAIAIRDKNKQALAIEQDKTRKTRATTETNGRFAVLTEISKDPTLDDNVFEQNVNTFKEDTDKYINTIENQAARDDLVAERDLRINKLTAIRNVSKVVDERKQSRDASLATIEVASSNGDMLTAQAEIENFVANSDNPKEARIKANEKLSSGISVSYESNLQAAFEAGDPNQLELINDSVKENDMLSVEDKTSLSKRYDTLKYRTQTRQDQSQRDLSQSIKDGYVPTEDELKKLRDTNRLNDDNIKRIKTQLRIKNRETDRVSFQVEATQPEYVNLMSRLSSKYLENANSNAKMSVSEYKGYSQQIEEMFKSGRYNSSTAYNALYGQLFMARGAAISEDDTFIFGEDIPEDQRNLRTQYMTSMASLTVRANKLGVTLGDLGIDTQEDDKMIRSSWSKNVDEDKLLDNLTSKYERRIAQQTYLNGIGKTQVEPESRTIDQIKSSPVEGDTLSSNSGQVIEYRNGQWQAL